MNPDNFTEIVELLHKYYWALTTAGFSEEQAFELTRDFQRLAFGTAAEAFAEAQ